MLLKYHQIVCGFSRSSRSLCFLPTGAEVARLTACRPLGTSLWVDVGAGKAGREWEQVVAGGRRGSSFGKTFENGGPGEIWSGSS